MFDLFLCFAENTEINFIRFAQKTGIYFIRFAQRYICFAYIFLCQSNKPLHVIDMVISYGIVREITLSGCRVLKVTCILYIDR